VLFKYFIRQLVVNVYLVFAIKDMKVITVGQVFALNLFEKVFAIFDRSK